jgi:hypothetical protein
MEASGRDRRKDPKIAGDSGGELNLEVDILKRPGKCARPFSI